MDKKHKFKTEIIISILKINFDLFNAMFRAVKITAPPRVFNEEECYPFIKQF